MRKIILSATIALAAVIGVAHASPGPLKFRSTAGSGITGSGVAGGEETSVRSRSALGAMLDSFTNEAFDVGSSSAAAAEPEVANGEECPEDKKTKVAEAEKGKGASKDKAPSGPEPVYFAF